MLAVALRLGLTSFGGPVAHIGYFRDEYVGRRRWLTDDAFGELVGVTSLLPGPTSSQLGMAIGGLRAGRRGALAAWVGFTLPSAILMTALGLGLARTGLLDDGVIRALGLVSVAVVALAVVAMQRSLAPDLPRLLLAVGALGLSLGVGGRAGQLLALGLGAVAGAVLLHDRDAPPALALTVGISRRIAAVCIAAFAGLLVALPIAARATGSHLIAFVDAFYRAGALVFGGGHVVLPLLESAVADPGWISQQAFLAGYGAAQGLPGPLFTFSAYLGAAADPEPNGVPGALLALAAIFLPAMLILAGALPLWADVRHHPRAQAIAGGLGAAVVGVLAAALWDPVIRTAIDGPVDVVLAVALGVATRVAPVWAVVVAAAVVGRLLL